MTAPIASSRFDGAPIFLETMISSLASSMFDITSPMTTPHRGL